ncbi:hypothetical protein CEXT_1881 [Caerostris extrusa]|uniref:Uncharacterized protein n=1 Tax=Caerostris extrusa TaxID=172846 RepID=A0AAV4XNN6_CAEEX|nr:hypothetical protein CEXT_1881 [Caerostris extrusa]
MLQPPSAWASSHTGRPGQALKYRQSSMWHNTWQRHLLGLSGLIPHMPFGNILSCLLASNANLVLHCSAPLARPHPSMCVLLICSEEDSELSRPSKENNCTGVWHLPSHSTWKYSHKDLRRARLSLSVVIQPCSSPNMIYVLLTSFARLAKCPSSAAMISSEPGLCDIHTGPELRQNSSMSHYKHPASPDVRHRCRNFNQRFLFKQCSPGLLRKVHYVYFSLIPMTRLIVTVTGVYGLCCHGCCVSTMPGLNQHGAMVTTRFLAQAPAIVFASITSLFRCISHYSSTTHLIPILMPFHPQCFPVVKKMSDRLLQKVNQAVVISRGRRRFKADGGKKSYLHPVLGCEEGYAAYQ